MSSTTPFLKEKVKDIAISFENLGNIFSCDGVLSRRSNSATLISVQETLANNGFIPLLCNSEHLYSSFIVIDKIRLLQELDSKLFGSKIFNEQCSVANNTKIVPLSHLRQSFPHYAPEMLVAFMTSLQFCHIVDPAVV